MPGVGDKALWRDSGRRLVVLKGEKVLALGLFMGIDVAGKDPRPIDPGRIYTRPGLVSLSRAIYAVCVGASPVCESWFVPAGRRLGPGWAWP